MKNHGLINNLGPHLLVDYSQHHLCRPWGSWWIKVILFIGILGALGWLNLGIAQAQSERSDPLVMKVYPDGTKVILRWSQLGTQVDRGEKYGGAPRIVAYDPAKDGIVPIGESSATSAATTNAATPGVVPSPASVQTIEPTPDVRRLDPTGPTLPLEGFYLGLQPGGSVVQNIILERVTASGTIGSDVVSGFVDATLVLDAGFRFDLPLGYRVNEWFSVEFAPGVIFNPMNSAHFNSTLNIGSSTFSGGATADLDGSLIQVPLLVNFILTIPTDSAWEPFLGGGVGALYSLATFNSISDSTGTLNIDQNADCWALGYSALAGLNYHVGNDISVGFVYKFTGTENQTFGGSTLGNLLNSTGTFTHSVAATATFRF